MEKQRYFLEVEIAYHKCGLLLSPRKYALSVMKETNLFRCTPTSTPVESNLDVRSENSDLYMDIKQHRRMIGKLIHLTVTRP